MAWTEEEGLKNDGGAPAAEGEKKSLSQHSDEASRLYQTLENVLSASVVEQRRARRWKIFFRFAFLLVLGGLIGVLFVAQQEVTAQSASGQVAVVPMRGVIGSGADIDANEYVSVFEDVYRNPQLKALLIEMNSPGGSPVHADILYQYLSQKKRQYRDVPILVVVEDLAASGGYYIAVAGDEILANPASLIGSIGVISAGFDVTELMEKLGVKRRMFIAGENKSFLDPFSELPAVVPEHWSSVLSETHKRFIDVVREGRNGRLVEDEKVFSGLVYSGDGAMRQGLIDGYDYSASILATRFAGLEPVYYEPAQDPWEQVAKEFGVSFSSQLMQMLRW